MNSTENLGQTGKTVVYLGNTISLPSKSYSQKWLDNLTKLLDFQDDGLIGSCYPKENVHRCVLLPKCPPQNLSFLSAGISLLFQAKEFILIFPTQFSETREIITLSDSISNKIQINTFYYDYFTIQRFTKKWELIQIFSLIICKSCSSQNRVGVETTISKLFSFLRPCDLVMIQAGNSKVDRHILPLLWGGALLPSCLSLTCQFKFLSKKTNC